ncbi:PAS domain S-box-containing protein [Arenibacter nanhaiticus]|uniref:histidine kinase n=1 Tax=Arenibacter nanhaiticus TaxID=558155 RepID=A0A1M6BWS9_9FLAO|nr:PAS domain S-box protein [Arenibacter nanhaiticus]SHI53131.1 PAS domain S-box-containing protein [Arenibacter nanhaiticus]
MIIKVLLLENAPVEIDLIRSNINDVDFNYIIKSIKLIDALESAVLNLSPDIILSGYSLLDCSGIEALQIRNKLYPSIPFIIISEHIEIDSCIELLKQGVTDIVLKQNISSLPHKLSRALKKSCNTNNDVLLKQRDNDHSCKIKLSKKEAWLQAIFDNSMEAILIANTDGYVLSANPAACEMLQMTVQELAKRHRSDIVDLTDVNLPRFIRERIEKGRCKGELGLVRKDGTRFPAMVTSVMFKDTFGKERISLTIRDLSKFKENQKKLAKTTTDLQDAINDLNKIMDSSLDVICTINEENRFVQISAACKSSWGYEPRELIGKNYLRFIVLEDQEATIQTDTEIKNGKPVRTFENRIIHKNGTIVYTMWSAKWDEDEKLFYCTAKDISEKKRIEKAYEVERQRFLDVYNLSPACMTILKGPNHIFELANPLYLELIGKKDIIGKSVKEVLPELKEQGIFELLNTVYITGESYIANEKLVKFDLEGNGELTDKYLNFLYQAHRDLDGNIDGIFVFSIDVTEQVLSRKKIEESEKLYRQLINELPIAAYSCDAEGKITCFNNAAVRLWGKEPEIGKDLFCVFKKITSQDGQIIPRHMTPMAIALEEARTVSGYAGTIENAKGETRFILPHVVPYIDSSGKVTGAVNVLTDLTESRAVQKDLELRNRELADYKFALDESSIVGITDQKGIIVHANENFCKISKYSKDELIGQDHKIISSDYHSKEYIRNLWKTIAHGETWKGELRNKAKDGSYYWVDTTITPFLNSKGKPYQYVATRFDITERKNAELILEKQNHELLKTNKELDRFVYSVSHDLRSPLTSIQGLASIIEDETKEPETLEHVQMIKNNINRLDEFTRKILSYSRNNRTDLEIQTIPIKETIADIVLSLQNIANAQGISFDIDVKENSTFYSDKFRFKTILENLISNAIKYHKDCNSDKFISVKAISDDNILQLKVSDNGIGIPLEYQEKIFDMFFRISSKAEGSGIGLYIVKDTIDKLEGSINVCSQVKTGTTFEIILKNFKIC